MPGFLFAIVSESTAFLKLAVAHIEQLYGTQLIWGNENQPLFHSPTMTKREIAPKKQVSSDAIPTIRAVKKDQNA